VTGETLHLDLSRSFFFFIGFIIWFYLKCLVQISHHLADKTLDGFAWLTRARFKSLSIVVLKSLTGVLFGLFIPF